MLADDTLELRLADVGDAAPTYLFAILLRGTDTKIGEISLRLDRADAGLKAYAGHIGYAIKAAHRGHRHALRACRLLAPLIRRHGFVQVWITTVPDNAASCRTLDLLGAKYVDTVAVPIDSDMRALGMHRVRRYCWDLCERSGEVAAGGE